MDEILQKQKIKEKLKELQGCDLYIIAQNFNGVEIMGNNTIYKEKDFLGEVLIKLINKPIKYDLLIVGFKNADYFCFEKIKTVRINLKEFKNECRKIKRNII